MESFRFIYLFVCVCIYLLGFHHTFKRFEQSKWRTNHFDSEVETPFLLNRAACK